jgi:hypothetical protein
MQAGHKGDLHQPASSRAQQSVRQAGRQPRQGSTHGCGQVAADAVAHVAWAHWGGLSALAPHAWGGQQLTAVGATRGTRVLVACGVSQQWQQVNSEER